MSIRKNRFSLATASMLAGIAAMALGACSGPDPKASEDTATADAVTAAADAAMEAAEAAANAPANSVAIDTAVEPAGDSLTGPQRNAARSATAYLNMTGFSRDGLINQLSSDAGEGYSVADATAAVDSLDVDWNDNAARSAKEYLDMTGFSCKGLIEQLSSSAGSQYTVEQATYGARAAGAC